MIEKSELEFLKAAALRRHDIDSDFCALRDEYQNYAKMSSGELGVMRARANCVIERERLLSAQLQATK